MKKQKKRYQFALISIVITIGLISNVFAETNYGVSLVLESPEPDIFFGSSIASEGKYIYIGAKDSTVGEYSKAGKVYIYDFDGNLVNTLESENPGQDMKFGTRIHIIEDMLMISEIHFGHDSRGHGKLHIYDLDGNYKQTLHQPEGDDSTFFGSYVSKIGDELLVVEPNKDTEDGKWTGNVHVYDIDGDLKETYGSPNPIIEGNFGARLASNEDLIVVSELIGNFGYGDHKKGRVYIFNSEWGLQKSLTTPENMPRDQFGYTLGVKDSYVFIGDRTSDVDGLARAGKIYVYNREGVGQYNITAPEPVASSYFGKTFTIQDDILIVGSPYRDTKGVVDSGKAYVFKTDGEFIVELNSPDPSIKGLFGESISTDGESIIVSETGSGKVYVFTRGTTDITITETETEAPEPEIEATKTNGGVPGYPIIALMIGLTIIPVLMRKKQTF